MGFRAWIPHPAPHGVLGFLLALGVCSRKVLSLRAETAATFTSLCSWVPWGCFHHPSPWLLTWEQLPPGHGCCPVALVLHESKAPVFGFVGRAGVDNDIHDPIRDLLHLRQDLLPLLGFGDAPHEQAAVVHAGTHPQEPPVPENTELLCQEPREGKLKAKPLFCPRTRGKHKASVSAFLWDIPRALLTAKAATLLSLTSTSKSGSRAEMKDLREKPKPNFAFPSWDSPFFCHQATAPPTPGLCAVTSISQDLLCSPVACAFPLTSWLRFWGKNIPCHGEAPFGDSLMATEVQTPK